MSSFCVILHTSLKNIVSRKTAIKVLELKTIMIFYYLLMFSSNLQFTVVIRRTIEAFLSFFFFAYTQKILVHRLHHLQYAGCTADSEQPLHRFRAYRCAKVRGKCCPLCAVQLVRRN